MRNDKTEVVKAIEEMNVLDFDAIGKYMLSDEFDYDKLSKELDRVLSGK